MNFEQDYFESFKKIWQFMYHAYEMSQLSNLPRILVVISSLFHFSYK